MSASGVPARPVAVRAGDTLPERTVGPLIRTDFVRYAGAGGDFNPIHHDEPMAREAGMPSVFGMGLLHAGMLGIQVARWLGPDNVRAYAVRFTGQVWPGDVLRFAGVVERVDPEGLATLALTVTREDGGEVVLRASASGVVAPA